MNPVYGSVNVYIKSLDRWDIIFFTLVPFEISLVTSIIILLIYAEIELYTKPIISVNATLKSKTAVMKVSGDHKGFSSVGYDYKLTFETDDGTEMVFPVLPMHYMTIIEGNKGVLKYKQGVYTRFVGFDIMEVSRTYIN